MDYESLKAAVDADETDFGAWSKLLAEVEQGATAYPERVAATFEAFLAKFPLCFGYWCKYADLQSKLGQEAEGAMEATGAIYDRALEAVPLSVELWKAYTAHIKAATQGEASDKLREAYKTATARVGHDPAAAGLWDSFMEFEADRGTPIEVCSVFRTMLASDASGRTDELWKRFKMLTKSYRSSELASEEECGELQKKWGQNKKDGNPQDELDQMSMGRTAGMSELMLQRQTDQMLADCEKAKNELVQSRLENQHYEAGVRRWYFHVKPLDDAQVRNWREYLTLVSGQAPTAGGDDAKKAHAEKVRALFERCLVPCALYAEFWLRYASWAREHLSPKEALAVATRAATVFLPRRPDVLAGLATLLEAEGRGDDARATYEAVAAAADTPQGKAAGGVLVANFERRLGNDDAAEAAYAAALDRGAAPAAVRAHLARYLALGRRDAARARAVLDEALAASPEDPALWQARAQAEVARCGAEKGNVVFAAVAAIYDKAVSVNSAVPLEKRGDLWAQYKACADDLCDDGAKLLALQKAYAKWRTKADLLARPLAPIPAPKRKRQVDAAPPAPMGAPPPPSADAGAELAAQYGQYAEYGM